MIRPLVPFFLFSLTFAASARDKLFIVEGGPAPSFVFAVRRGADSPDRRLPPQLARALASVREVIVPEPIWNKRAMKAKVDVPDQSYLTGGTPLFDLLSRESFALIQQLASPAEQKFLDTARPGMVLALMEGLFAAYLRDQTYSTGDSPDVTRDVATLTRALFGREVSESELAELRAREGRSRGPETFRHDHLIYEAARHRDIEVDTLLQFEAVPNVHAQYDRSVDVEELDRALKYLGQRLRTEIRLRRVRDDLQSLINARYLTMKNEAIQSVSNQAVSMRTPGRGRLNRAVLSRHLDWRATLAARFAARPTFVAVPLEAVVGNERLKIPGLRHLLVDDGFRVSAVELGCAAHLH